MERKIRDIYKLLNKGVVLIYGEAGSGKTNLSLWLLSTLSRRYTKFIGFYISTEGKPYKAVVSRLKFNNKVYFIDAINMNHLLNIVLNIYYDDVKPSAIFVDSVNNFYRAEVLYDKNATRYLNSIMAILNEMRNKYQTKILVTAQVHAIEGEISLSGESILRFWSDIILKLNKAGLSTRELIIEYPPELAGPGIKFRIGEGGIRDCGEHHR